MKKAITLVVVLMMVVGLLVAGGCDSADKDQATPEAAIAAFLKAMEDKDAEKVAALTGEKAEEVDFEGYDELGSYTIGEVKTTSDTEATAKVTFAADAEGTEMSIDFIFPMNKIDDKWVIDIENVEIDWEFDDLDFDMDFDMEDLEWDDEDLNLDEETEELEEEEQ